MDHISFGGSSAFRIRHREAWGRESSSYEAMLSPFCGRKHAQTVQPSARRYARLHPESNRSEGFSKIMNFLEAKFLSISQDYFMFPSNEILRS